MNRTGNYEWFNTKEAAAYLKVSVNQLLNLTSNGQITYFKFNRSNRYRRDLLDEILNREIRGPHAIERYKMERETGTLDC